MINQYRLFFLVTSSFIVAWMLMSLPLPADWQWIKPQWVMLVLIYWIFVLPQTMGVLTAWSVGLIIDILGGGLLGQHALSLAVVAYLGHLLRNRLRLFPFWQQALAVLVLIGSGKLMLLLVQWLTGHPPRTPLYWVSTITSVLIWPWVYRVLRAYGRKILQ